MKRKTILLIVAGAVVLFGAAAFIFGPYIYRDFIVGEAADTPTVSLSNTDSTITAESASGTWTATNDSYAGYRLDEVLRGVDVTVVGRTNEVSGSIEIANSQVTSGSLTIDVASIKTTESNRDSYFRSNVAETDEFPTATFELSEPITIPDAAYTDKQGDQEVKGKLTIHGVTKDVTITVEAGYDGTATQIAGSMPIAWADYNMPTPSLGFVEVEPSGFIEFLIILQK